MNDAAIILPALALPTPIGLGKAGAPIAKAPAKRGRKSETPAQRLERLQHAVADAKIAAKDAERRMYAIVGEAMLAEAEAQSDGAFMARVVEVLRKRVTSATAKADIASLLAAHPLPGAARSLD